MPRPLAPCNGLALLIALRVGGLAYACNDTLSEAAITDIMGPRLSAALASSAETSRSSGLLRCSVAAPSSLAAHDRGPVADVTSWQSTPQQIAFAVISTGGSSWTVDVAFEDPQNVYPSSNSSLPTARSY